MWQRRTPTIVQLILPSLQMSFRHIYIGKAYEFLMVGTFLTTRLTFWHEHIGSCYNPSIKKKSQVTLDYDKWQINRFGFGFSRQKKYNFGWKLDMCELIIPGRQTRT